MKHYKSYSTSRLLLNVEPSLPVCEGERFRTTLFLSKNPERIAEGGLRLKGLFKYNYKFFDGKWYACDFNGKNIFEVDLLSNIELEKYKNKRSLPLMSIVTVVYNGEAFLEEAIKSVLKQTYPNVEYIIIDGGSTDNTLNIIRAYDEYIDYWVSEPDGGIYHAMNKGISLALGQIVGILNSDDFYENYALSKIYESFDDNTDVVYGNARVLLDDKPLFVRITGDIKDIVKDMVFYHPESFVRLKLYKRLGLYSTKYRIASDYDFFLKAFLYGAKFKKIDDVIVNFRLGGAAYKNVYLKLKEVWKVKHSNGLGILNSSVYFAKELIKFYVKRLLKLNETSKLLYLYRKFLRKDMEI